MYSCTENIHLSVYFIALYLFASVDFSFFPTYTKLLFVYISCTLIYTTFYSKKHGENVFVFCLLTVFSDLWTDKKRNPKSPLMFRFMFWKCVQISAYLINNAYKIIYYFYEMCVFINSKYQSFVGGSEMSSLCIWTALLYLVGLNSHSI